MKAYTVVTFLMLIFQYSYGSQVRSPMVEEDELVAVTVLYRDGDKTPSSSFPNDPYFNENNFPMGFGQLTENGKIHQYELGQWYRQRYNSFLPEAFNTKDIHVRSSDTDRTLMSAQVNLAGLYPPTDSQLWNKDILWQPVPVHTLPTNEDQVLYMSRPCAKFYRIYDEIKGSSYYQSINEEFADFYQEMSELTGWQIDDADYFYKLQQVLYSYSHYDLSYVPSWYSDDNLETIDYLAGVSAARYTYNDDLKRLGDGPFFDNLISNFHKALDPSGGSPKLFMLSGHESTIVSVLNGVGLFDHKVPEHASSLIWELRKNSEGDYYVNWLYKRNASEVLTQLTLEGCDFNCNYDTFKTLLEPFTVDLGSWDQECLDN